jgi:hypothetical protein
MGSSHGNFFKYPRTPHLFGSTGTDDDKHLGLNESQAFIADASLIVEEKIDGTNVGIHFSSPGCMVLQCRGHEITAGMHPQYDLFKQWAAVKAETLEIILADRYILYGEWLYAKHSVHYRALPHYFFEFDMLDKQTGNFLDLEARMKLLEGSGVQTVPVVSRGALKQEDLRALIRESKFKSVFDNPLTGKSDALMEGLYLRTEAGGIVSGRAKFVRPEFTEKVKQSEHWQHQPMVPNVLIDGVDIWQ